MDRFIEGDFDTYVSQMRKPHVWGGEPELFMASHVLQWVPFSLLFAFTLSWMSLCVYFSSFIFFFFWFYNWNALVWSKKLWKNIYPHESNTCLMNKYWSQFLRSCLLAILVHLIQCPSAIIFPVLSFGFAYLGASSPFKKNIIKLRTLNWHEPEVLITAGCRSQSTCMIRILVA